MIFIKPTVLRTSADGREITSERYDYLRGEQERQTPPARLFWNDPTQPSMPREGVMPGTPGRRRHAAADGRQAQAAAAPTRAAACRNRQLKP